MSNEATGQPRSSPVEAQLALGLGGGVMPSAIEPSHELICVELGFPLCPEGI
jgi:hypothetical protein